MEKYTTKQLLSRYEDCLELASKAGRAFMGFLTAEQCQLLEGSLPKRNGLRYMLWGGAENCERKYLGLSKWELVAEDFPIVALQLEYPAAAQLTHRDFLGSLINSGIARASIGDIFKTPTGHVLLISENVADAVLYSPMRVGRYSVGVEKISAKGLTVERSFEELAITAASVRLDAVVAEISGLSRKHAKELIDTGRVRVGIGEVQKADRELKVGEILSVRGYGKYIFCDIVGKTRRDRYKLVFKKYI